MSDFSFFYFLGQSSDHVNKAQGRLQTSAR